MKWFVSTRVASVAVWMLVFALLPHAAFAQRTSSKRKASRPQGPIYYVIPLKGEVGVAMTTELIASTLEHAEQLEPDVVVMEINSPGGLVSEMLSIFDVVMNWQRRHPKQHVVAVVSEEALSAAAMIAMAFDEIYMMPGSTIGAAMVVNFDETGKMERAQEKIESAVRAKARTVAEFGGHNPVIVEAMIDPSLSLWQFTDSDEEVMVVSSREMHKHIQNLRKLKKRPTEILRSGKLLTLTADEAVKCGLSAGVVDNYASLMEQLDLADAVEYDDFARKAVTDHQRKIERIMKEFERLGTLIGKVQGGAEMRTLADIQDQRASLGAVQACIRRIEKMVAEHSSLENQLDASMGVAFEAIKVQVARDLVALERMARDARARLRRGRR